MQTHEDFKKFCTTSPALAITCCIGAITTMCMIVCCYGRSFPLNYWLLLAFTLFESYGVAGMTAQYESKSVIVAGLATALVTISLTIYAMFTKVKMEVFYAMAFVVCLAMIPLMIASMIMGNGTLYTMYCCLGVIFYSLFLIIDTKQICEAGRSYGQTDSM